MQQFIPQADGMAKKWALALLLLPATASAAPICNETWVNRFVCGFLTQQYAVGLAAGNTGDYYDNCDAGHAYLGEIANDHPQVTEIATLRGFQRNVLADKVVVGNASLVWIVNYGPDGSTLSNVLSSMLGTASGPHQLTYNQYAANNFYWYPEHHDHDATDHHIGMTPSVGISQGSSGSELDEVKKWMYTLAAFKPAVKTKLKNAGLLMPTVQMISRRTLVNSDAEYRSGKAHKNAAENFDSTLAMVQMANGIDANNVPPVARIRVLNDTYNGVQGTDFFGGSSEHQYDTPTSIARIWKGREYTKRLTVSAADSLDLNNRALTYHWAVVRGDPAHVRFTPRNAQRSEMDIEIDYHPETTIEGETRLTSLVVVGVFVDNGAYHSAPAFITSYTPNNEVREYEAGTNRLLKVTHNTKYVYHGIAPRKSWQTDTYHYGPTTGQLTGWSRVKDGVTTAWTKEGYLVVTQGPQGQPLTVQRVGYIILNNLLTWSPSGSAFPYVPSTENEAPLVNAGNNQTVLISAAANLVGVVTDDGLPASPGTVSVTWSKFSGPGTITFTQANNRNTTARFSAAGSYILRLTATDGALTSSDDVIITVMPAPTVPDPNPDPDPVPDPEQAPSVQSNVINPSRGEKASFACSGAQVMQYNRQGKVVGTQICSNDQASWDGRDAGGVLVASGVYVVDTGRGRIKVVVVK